MPKAHTYLRTHRLAGQVLQFDLASEERKLRDQAASAKSGRAAKTLVKEGRLRITLVALRRGASLGSHAVGGDVSVHVLRGAFTVTVGDRAHRATAGSLIALQASVRHDATATRDATVLITAAMR